MLIVNDILTDLDVLAIDSTVLDNFGPTQESVAANLAEKRRVSVDDWIHSALKKAGMSPVRHSIRFAPDKVLGYTSSVFTDYTTEASDKTLSNVPLATILATPSTDALYIGHDDPPAGLWATLLDNLNANSLAVASLSYWAGGAWRGFNSLVDGSRANSLVSFSGGGRFSWQTPSDWQPRPLNGEADWRFWCRLTAASTLTASTALTHILPIQRSRLTYPAALHTLTLLYRESWGAQSGEWRAKAEEYAKLADTALQSALIGLDEFLADETDGTLAQAVQKDVPVPPARDLTSWERG